MRLLGRIAAALTLFACITGAFAQIHVAPPRPGFRSGFFFQSSFVAPTAPVFYDFIVGEGWGTGTALSVNGSNGFTTLQDLSGAGSSAAIKVNTTGGYMFGTSANSAWHAAKSITTGDGWVTYTVLGTTTLEMQRNMVGVSDSFSGLRWVYGPGAQATNILRVVTNGTVTTNISIGTFDWAQAGDKFTFATDSVNNRFTPYLNGRQLTLSTTVPVSGYDISALTITGQHGIIGNASATGALEDLEYGDSTMGQILLYQPSRVVQREANGDVIFKASGTYSKSTPAALKYNITTSAKVAVQTAQTLQSATIASGVFSGVTTAFTPAASTSYILTVYRDDATGANGSIIKGQGPYVLPGEEDGAYGQSNMANTYSANGTTTVWTTPANAFTYEVGGAPANGDAILRKYVTNSSAIAAAFSTLSAAYGGIPTGLIEGGIGSTTIEDRSPVGLTQYSGVNEATYYSFLNGLKMAGLGIRYCHWKDGESNANNAALSAGNTGNITSYPTTFVALANLMDAYNGRAMVYLMSPIGSYAQTNDTSNIATWEGMRRAQAKLVADNPTRIKLSSFTLDLQHDAIQPQAYHYTSESYGIFWHREMVARSYLEGLSAYTLVGPYISSVVKHSNTEVDVTFNKNTLDSLTLMNSCSTDCRYGLRFGTTSASILNGAGGDLSSTVAPVQQSTTGTTETWRFTLTASTSGSIFVAGPGGQNPFNPTNNATINASFRTLAPIFAGVKTGEENVGLQPLFCLTGAGNDNSTLAGCTIGNDWLIAA